MIFIVTSKLLSLDNERVSALLADEHDGGHSGRAIEIEQDPVFAEESQLALCDGIRPQGLEVPCLGRRVRSQYLFGRREQEPAVLAAKPAEVVDHRCL